MIDCRFKASLFALTFPFSQYGVPKLVEWLKKHQLEEHAPPLPAEEWEVLVTCGSQDALSKTFDLLLNEGDVMLTELPTYR